MEELPVPANPGSQYRFDAPAIAALARRMRNIAPPFFGKAKCKICASRRDRSKGGALGRNYVNVENHEKRMRKMGYRQVEISRLDPDAQFRICANCSDIVGIHGAGMMNMPMMPEGSKCAEIVGAPVDPIPVRHAPTSVGRRAMAAGHDFAALSGNRIAKATRRSIWKDWRRQFVEFHDSGGRARKRDLFGRLFSCFFPVAERGLFSPPRLPSRLPKKTIRIGNSGAFAPPRFSPRFS